MVDASETVTSATSEIAPTSPASRTRVLTRLRTPTRRHLEKISNEDIKKSVDQATADWCNAGREGRRHLHHERVRTERIRRRSTTSTHQNGSSPRADLCRPVTDARWHSDSRIDPQGCPSFIYLRGVVSTRQPSTHPRGMSA